MTRQAVQLDLLPRVKILQTSADAHGQIYVPVDERLHVLRDVRLRADLPGLERPVGRVRRGRERHDGDHDAARRDRCARRLGSWPVWRVVAVFGLFGIVDFAFVLGNATKIPSGGWIPLALAAAMFAVFVTWRDGRALLRAELQRRAVPDRGAAEAAARASRACPAPPSSS